jgi:hypothetical protein
VTVFAWYTNDHNGQSVAIGDDRLQHNESRRVSSYQHAGLDRSYRVLIGNRQDA